MRIAFMGTPDFAVPTLTEIVSAGHEIVAVYTRAPKPAGRGQAERKSPIHLAAEGFGIPVRTPKSLRNEDEQAAFAALDADVGIVVAYGLILPKPILDAPRLGCLNLHGSVIPTMIFGAIMGRQRRGSIVNISSMAAQQALSGVLGYSIAKAGIDNLTRWMAVEMASKFGDGVRVNAIAPGFFVADQNRAVLLNPDGSYTKRAQTVIAKTPMGRFGSPDELNGAVQWLCSDAASFVTGTVIPIDGGFSAFSGV